FAPDEAHVVLVDKATGKPVPRLELRAQDGRALAPEDTVVVHPSAIRPTKRQRAKAG
ncbi:transcriptional regulator, partial [Pseudomonas syringae pv. actinidiae]|nr:transcriptional regulator [Pseudomonas syringae pv. actinidiae]